MSRLSAVPVAKRHEQREASSRNAEGRLSEVAHAVRDHEDSTRKAVTPASPADDRLYRRLRRALHR